MELPPPLEIGDFKYVPRTKPVILLFPTGDVAEFGTVETAENYLRMARQAGANGATEAVIFFFQQGQWFEVR